MNFVDILFVDDTELNRFVFAKNMEKHYEIQTLENADELFACLQTFRPKVLILDWMMPVFSGMDILRKLRSQADYADLIIIIMTAKCTKEDAIFALNNGANDFIVKPPHYPELMARINSLLRQKAAEQSRRLTNQLQACHYLVSGLRHEYNNIFGSMKLFMQMVDLSGFQYFCDKKQDVLELVSRGMNLMDSFRDFFVSELSSRQTVDVRELLQEAVQRQEWSHRQYSLQLPSIPALLLGNRDKLAQVFSHLLSNAIHATTNRDQALVKIQCEALEEGLRIRISDNGIGMAPEQVHRLGDLFYTTKGALGGTVYDNKTTGTGLGIPISLQILRLHGASMHFQSVLGQGTQVTIQFPLDQSPD